MEGALDNRLVTAPATRGLPPRRVRVLGRLRHERGTAVVEFAIVAPLLLLLVFATIDFSRALNYYNNLTEIVGQGARAAAVNRNPDGTSIGTTTGSCPTAATSLQCQLVQDYMTTGEVKNKADVCITPSEMPTTTGDPVTVRATYDFNLLPGIHLLGINFTTITLRAKATNRFEGLTPSYSSGDYTINGTSGSACGTW